MTEALQQIIPIAVMLSIAVLVFSIGLDATLQDVTSLFRHPQQLFKSIFAVNVVTPIVAAILIAILPLSAASKAGLMLMAVSPVPPFIPVKALKISGGDRAYVYGLFCALAALSVIIVPATVKLLARIYRVDVDITAAKVAGNVTLSVLLPLGLGILVHARLPKFAARAAPIMQKVAMGLLVIVVLPLVIKLWPAMMHLLGDGTALAAVVMAASALVVGHFLGGPDLHERGALAVTSAARHPGIALMIAGANAMDKTTSAAIILILLIGLIVITPYQIWIRRRERQSEHPDLHPVPH
jgi:BASS family bile acid:Na+ symporter